MGAYSRGKKKTRKATLMDEFIIDEISGVDNPAQPGALAGIMKRAPEQDLSKGVFLTGEAEGHQHSVVMPADGSRLTMTSYEGEHSHSVVLNEDGSMSVGMVNGHTHSLAADGGGPDTSMEKSMSDSNTAERIQELETRLAKAEALGSLSDEQKAFYSKLDASGQESFLAASSEARQDQVEKSREEDPVVYKTLDGRELRKSAGEDALAEAKRADRLEKRLAAAEAAADFAKFEKRAENELGNFKGTVEVRAALVKAVDGITDSTVRGEVLEALTAANTHLAKSFERTGNAGDGSDISEENVEKAREDLDSKAAEIRKNNPKLSASQAYAQACRENKDLVAASRGQ